MIIRRGPKPKVEKLREAIQEKPKIAPRSVQIFAAPEVRTVSLSSFEADTYIVPYASIHGILLAGIMDVLDGGMAESGGERDLSNFSGPGRDDSDIRENGYGPVKYSFRVNSYDREVVEEIVAEIRTMPPESEIYPREEDRCNYVTYGHATRPKVDIVFQGARNLYYTDIEVTCRNNLLCGPDQGIDFSTNVGLPQTVSLTNEGRYTSYLDYLYASGKYDASLGLTRDLRLQMGDYDLRLCDQLMGRDSFKLDRFGNCQHTKETSFPENYTALQAELGGSDFLDYGTGGAMAYEALLLGNDATLMFPFYGPLPVQSAPYLKAVLSRIVGAPLIYRAFASDLSDTEAIDFTLKIGTNEVYIPDCEGEDFVAFGIVTDGSSSCTISSVKAQVNRYIAQSSIPMVETGEDFDIVVSDGTYSNHMLSGFALSYRDLF